MNPITALAFIRIIKNMKGRNGGFGSIALTGAHGALGQMIVKLCSKYKIRCI